jgi:hypothetical protein
MFQKTPQPDSVTSAMGYLEYTELPLDTHMMPGDMPAVLDYWRAVQGAYFAPTWGEFNLHEMPSKALPMSVVVDVLGDDPLNARFVYRFWGTRRAELYGRENKGREVREALPEKSGPIIAEQCTKVLLTKKPILFRNIYPLKPAQSSTCITLRLPIASGDGTKVAKIATTAIIVDNPKAFAGYQSASRRSEVV